ncbi:LuxR C-terminal-related transcriptional regulator [Mycobacterium sp. 1274761.0]|uniref:helix-turn-helix transcriptional regulator n=1 Tax=Mycobacterium sp. 1274761.0 TaxID=1834077 RepID=UPI001E35F6A7|nr:LuxR C-terminal-related transcriptional regulator [Mycobacterium sp. 1274761.0]
MSAPEVGALGVADLPTGTVTLLLADVEGSTRLWDSQPDDMTAALPRLNHTVDSLVAAHGGVRPVEQGEGDSFVIAFARASDAVACALELQRASLAPLRLRIGIHTGQIQLRDEGNYAGPTINRAARLRDLGHGGQTLLSGATEPLVVDWLPGGAWLTDLGTHPLRDLPRPERVVQLCHPDTCNDFPPLRTSKDAGAPALPTQLTSFVGRGAQMDEVRGLLRDNRLVNLTGAGGAGKTRLAVEVAARAGGDFPDGVIYVDLAPVTHPDVVPVAVARAVGLPDQPGRSTIDNVVRALGHKRVLMLVDNCEHLLEPSAALVNDLLGACPALCLLATSREPLGVPGEVTFLVPSLSIDDEAIELFVDRARRVRPDFTVAEHNQATLEEICRRLDGMPLAIELAAARVRALSLDDILGSLHDRFRLLTGGARTAVRRQQTLRASVDWSHALLTDPERVLFRRLAVFLGGFDLDAAQAVAGTSEVERYQVLDQLTLLVDKSLVVAENTSGRTRYRLLETVRQYALEKLGESGEANDVRLRHRDHYVSEADALNHPERPDYLEHLERINGDIDNLRAAFAWSLEADDVETALRLASSMFPVWQDGGRNGEGIAWMNAAFAHADASSVDTAVRSRALVDKVMLGAWTLLAENVVDADQAVTLARTVGDPKLLIRALIGRGVATAYDAEATRTYFTEATELAEGLDDPWIWSQLHLERARSAMGAGNPAACQEAAAKAYEIAAEIGDRTTTRTCLWAVGWARAWLGDITGALAKVDRAIDEAAAAHDTMLQLYALLVQGFARSHLGDVAGARASAEVALDAASDLMEFYVAPGYATLAMAYQAAGDGEAATAAYAKARRQTGVNRMMVVGVFPWAALSALSSGDVDTARQWADEAVGMSYGCFLSVALMARAQVRLVQGELDGAEQDAQDALSAAVEAGTQLRMQSTLECLATLAALAGSHREAARLFGAGEAMRQRTGEVRFPNFDADYVAAVNDLRAAMAPDDFDAAWTEGAALSTDEAIAYAQRGRGERKRPTSGWASLTPTEQDVVRLVSDGLANKDIATRLFMSPRTVETHLTHVYAKLGLSSRVQLAQEAAKHTR